MSMPLDGALYISNGRKRRGTSTPRVLSGLGDLMAFTISNPFYMNRARRSGKGKSKARAAHARRRQRDAKGRFLSKGRSRSKARSKALASGKRKAAKRRASLTARELQALARRYGYVAKIHKKKKRTISDAQKAKMKSARAENQAKLKARYGTGINVGEDVFAEKPMSREELMAARQSAQRDLASLGQRLRQGGASDTEVRDATAKAISALPEYLRPNRRKHRKHYKNGRRSTRRNGLYDRGLALVGQAPLGLGSAAVTATLAATAVGAHLLAAKAINFAASKSAIVADGLRIAAPVGFTLTGVAVKAGLLPAVNLVESIPLFNIGSTFRDLREAVISDAALDSIGNLAVAVGAALDAYRFVKGTSSTLNGIVYGDGGAYEIVPYSSHFGPMAQTEMGGIVYGAIEGGGLVYGGIVYGGADLADAAHCGTDLSGDEADTARKGQAAWLARFPAPTAVTATRASGRASDYAGRHGYRWAWVIKLVGWEKFQQIAALAPAQRCRVIAQLRLQAMNSLQQIISNTAALPEMSSPVTSSPTLSGLNYAGLEYGGIVYAGEGM